MSKRCTYGTLLTKDSYLPGVLILNRSLKAHQTSYPLIVQCGPDVSEAAKAVLAEEGLELSLTTEMLKPPTNKVQNFFRADWIDAFAKLTQLGWSGYDVRFPPRP